MNKSKKIIVILIFVLLLSLFILTKCGISEIEFLPDFKYKRKILSLDEIKENLLETNKIYVCKDWYKKTSKCDEDKLVSIVDNQDTIDKFIDITKAMEDDSSNKGWSESHDIYTLYFLDDKDKTIVSAEFGIGYKIISNNSEYSLNETRIDELREIIGIDKSLIEKVKK